MPSMTPGLPDVVGSDPDGMDQLEAKIRWVFGGTGGHRLSQLFRGCLLRMLGRESCKSSKV